MRLRTGEGGAVEAGKIMLRRLRELAAQKINFAFETTLASRSFAPWLEQLMQSGYRIHLFFLALPTPEAALARVRHRVSLGGHNVEPEIIRRRFSAGLRNLFTLYMPLVSSWVILDNTSPESPQNIAEKIANNGVIIGKQVDFQRMKDEYGQT